MEVQFCAEKKLFIRQGMKRIEGSLSFCGIILSPPPPFFSISVTKLQNAAEVC